jgi:hypothetical protein
MWTFYRVPLTWVAFGSFLVGMAVMLLAGLHADLRVRRFLRERFVASGEREGDVSPVDRAQQDLFRTEPEAHDDVPPPSTS